MEYKHKIWRTPWHTLHFHEVLKEWQIFSIVFITALHITYFNNSINRCTKKRNLNRLVNVVTKLAVDFHYCFIYFRINRFDLSTEVRAHLIIQAWNYLTVSGTSPFILSSLMSSTRLDWSRVLHGHLLAAPRQWQCSVTSTIIDFFHPNKKFPQAAPATTAKHNQLL